MFQRIFSPLLFAGLLLLATLLLLNMPTLAETPACDDCLILDQPIDMANIPVVGLPQPFEPVTQPLFEPAASTAFAGLLGGLQVLPNPGTVNRSSVVADVDGNGLNDVVVIDGSGNPSTFYFYYQTVTGTLDAPVALINQYRTRHFVIADLNDDDRPDLAFNHRISGFENALIVRLQAADGSFEDPISYEVDPNTDILMVITADFNHDTLADVAVSAGEYDTMVFFQTVSGTLSVPLVLTSTVCTLVSMTAADVNNDDRVDIVRQTSARDDNPNQVNIYEQTDNGFTAAIPYPYPAINSTDVAAGDLNDDGLTDLAVVGRSTSGTYMGVLYQNVSGTLDAITTYPNYGAAENVGIADIDQDGRNDIIATHRGSNRVTVQYQAAGGGFPYFDVFWAPISASSVSQAVSIGDFTGDDLPDVAVADSNEDLVTLRHTGLLQHNFMSMIFNEKVNPIFDDFSNPHSGWPIATTSTTRYRYLNGTYQIQNLTDSFSALASAGHLRRDYDMEVEVRKVGAAQGGYGLVYGMTDNLSEFYVFLVWPDYHEIWSLHYTAANGFTLLQAGVNNTFVNGGEAWNTLRVVKSNISVSLYVNGHLTSQHPYTQSGWRRLGFFTAPIDAFFDSRYDNYSVVLP